MQYLIIAAGRGSRLANRCDSKPLLAVAGKSLIEWVVGTAARAGFREFVVVTGYNGEALRPFLAEMAPRLGVALTTVENDQWQRENGLSVLKAREAIRGNFILSMADHIFDLALLEKMKNVGIAADELILAVDEQVEGNPRIDIDDVTKVFTVDGLIRDIGKNLARYNAFDTGIFRCTPALFTALATSMEKGDFTLSGGVRVLAGRGKARVLPTGGAFWLDVDDEAALAKAEKWLEAKHR